MAGECKPVDVSRFGGVIMYRCEDEPDGPLYARSVGDKPEGERAKDIKSVGDRPKGERTGDVRGAEIPEPSVSKQIQSEMDIIEERIATGGGSTHDDLRSLFSPVEGLAKEDPEAAMERLDGLFTLADHLGSEEMSHNIELYMECLTYMQDEEYSLERAVELAAADGIGLRPDDPVVGLSEALYPEPGSELAQSGISGDMKSESSSTYKEDLGDDRVEEIIQESKGISPHPYFG